MTIVDITKLFSYREEIVQTKPKKSLFFLRDNTYINSNYPSWCKESAYHKKQSVTYYLFRNVFNNIKDEMNNACHLTNLITNGDNISKYEPQLQQYFSKRERFIQEKDIDKFKLPLDKATTPSIEIIIEKPKKYILNKDPHPEDIAEQLYQKYGEDLKLVNNKGKYHDVYYLFVEHLWKEINGEIFLKQKMRMDINKDIKCSKLKDPLFKKQVISECRDFFIDAKKEIDELIDLNPNFLGFNNGIYLLKDNIFRDGQRGDYVHLSTEYDFNNYTWEDSEIKEVMNFLFSIQPNLSVLEKLLKLLRSFLNGYQKHVSYLVLFGTATKSKKIFLQLIVETLGQYIAKLPSKLITGESDFNPLNAEMANMRGKRIAIFEIINNGKDPYSNLSPTLLNELTNRETIITRKHYNEPFEFKPQFDIIVSCLNCPDNLKHRNVFDFKVDCHYTNNIDLKQWKSLFMWILLNYQYN